MQELKKERRALHLIAAFKMFKGVILLATAIAFLFLDQRSQLLNSLILWTDDQLMFMHSKLVMWLLNRTEVLLQSTDFRTTGIAALMYSALLFTEGYGVWKGMRWAEWLMVLGTASLIPLEVMHFIHKPSFLKVLVICANAAIVIYLFLTLRRQRAQHKS